MRTKYWMKLMGLFKINKPSLHQLTHVTKNVKALATSIESVISKDECEYKCNNESKVKK